MCVLERWLNKHKFNRAKGRLPLAPAFPLLNHIIRKSQFVVLSLIRPLPLLVASRCDSVRSIGLNQAGKSNLAAPGVSTRLWRPTSVVPGSQGHLDRSMTQMPWHVIATVIRESSQRRSSAMCSRPGLPGTLIPLGCRTTEGRSAN